MEGFPGQRDASNTAATMTARVLTEAKRAFGDRADEPRLERFAREAVDDLWRESIVVTSFVPVLALRRIRDLLDDDLRGTARATPRA